MHAPIPRSAPPKGPSNKGRLIGQKRPLKPKDVWAIRARLHLESRKRDLALFNLAIDSKLRGCDLVQLKSTIFALGAGFENGQPSSRKRPGGQSSSKSLSRPGPRSKIGYARAGE